MGPIKERPHLFEVVLDWRSCQNKAHPGGDFVKSLRALVTWVFDLVTLVKDDAVLEIRKHGFH